MTAAAFKFLIHPSWVTPAMLPTLRAIEQCHTAVIVQPDVNKPGIPLEDWLKTHNCDQ